MAYADLLRRLETEAERVTPVTSGNPAQVTEKTQKKQSGNPGNPGNPQKFKQSVAPSEQELASNQDPGEVQRVWFIQIQGRTFPMIRPGGLSRAEAETAARARWPDAQVLAEEPRSGA